MIKEILVLEFYFYNWRGTSLLSEVRHILVSEVGNLCRTGIDSHVAVYVRVNDAFRCGIQNHVKEREPGRGDCRGTMSSGGATANAAG